jgi:ketosteroid isomerase-like protein
MAAALVIALLVGALVDAGPSRVPAQLVGGQPENANVTAIRAVLATQVAAWNRGDIDGFMNGYDRAETTTFISGDQVTRGWQTVLDRYKRNYDSREKMGTLAFSDLTITRRLFNQYVVTGRWQLSRQGETPRGGFTLIFRRTADGWRIIHDHTTSASGE